MSCPLAPTSSSGCPYSKDPSHKITPPILGAHLVAVNLGLFIARAADLKLISSSCNFFAISLLLCLIAVQFKKYLGVEFNYSSPSTSSQSQQKSESCCLDFSNPESVKGFYIHLYTWVNNAIQKFRKVVLLQDKVYSLQVVGSLYLLSKFAGCLGDFGIIFLVANIACICPYVCQNHSEQIKAIVEQIKAKVNPLIETVLSKITAKPKQE